ncbi:MAG: fumarylacetoacetate hydrolase family protein [Betaproteobacteria bacterium]|nr:fumarylacetoacetate hydrolase family protein [Betaproteobacteria bacterium]
MRLVTFAPGKGAALRVGLVRDGDQVVDLAQAGGKPPFDAHDMISLIAAGRKALKWLGGVAAKAKKTLPIEKVRLAAPIPRPRKNVFCVGWNYVEHFEESRVSRLHTVEFPAHPTFFSKVPTTVNGPYDPVPSHAGVTAQLDWEVELGVVIGRRGIDIKEADALKHVFGYTVVNDISAREIQRRHGGQLFKGKGLDGTCPMGPWIVTADEVPDPHALYLTSRVNGVTKQDSNTRYMYFKIPRLIAELSAGMTLEPGDILSTGTPAGVGHARTPPEFMKAGDVLESEIAGLGLLRNKIGN